MTAKERYEILVAYCKMKIESRDWHAVSDAANDIRELLAKYPDIETR
jgi:outer membrane protein assembly factor BamD (BamD/ComL family)